MASAEDGPLCGLDDVVVLDLSGGLSGAYGAKLLADAGARVVRVEDPSGHPLRRACDAGELGPGDTSALFGFLAAGQESVVVDPTSDVARKEILALADASDVVLDEGPSGGARRYGLTAEDLRRANPSLVIVTLSPFGGGSPRQDDDCPNFLLQALSGSLYNHGVLERVPLALGGGLSEVSVGVFASVAALCGLAMRARTGDGDHFDVSLLECLAVTHVNYPALAAVLPGGAARRTTYTMIPGMEPCEDGYVGLATITTEQWHSFLAMIERPDLVADDSLLHIGTRMERADEVLRAIHDWTRSRTVADVVERAALYRVPSAPVGNGATVPELEHVIERGVYRRGPSGFRQPRSPFRSSLTAPTAPRPAPALGQSRPLERAAPAMEVTPRSLAAPSAQPLDGIRVLDFTAFLAGPFATTNLAMLGAEVLKVESIQRPDPARFSVTVDPSVDQWYEQGSWFLSANLDKAGLTINLADPRGRDLIGRLAEQCDVVIENFTPRVMEQFGLTYDYFSSRRPDVIMLRMPGFGLDGPWSNRPGFAATMEHLSGMAWITGYPDGPLAIPGICDPIAGMHAVFATLAALRERARSGRGQLIELTMLEMAANLAAQQVVEYDAYRHLMTRAGNRSRTCAPQGVYACCAGNQWVAVSTQDDRQWAGLRAAMGDPAWAADPKLETLDGRHRAHDALDEHLAEWCSVRTPDEVIVALRAAGVACEPVVHAYAIDADEQMNARSFWEEIDHPIVGRQRYPAMPMRIFSRHGPWHRAHAPLLGEHTVEILRSMLGVSDDELTDLSNARVIGTRPLGVT